MVARIVALSACLVLTAASLGGLVLAQAEPIEGPEAQPSDCQAFQEEMKRRSNEHWESQQKRRAAFYAEQASERENFSKSNHTEEERKAFHERQAGEARELEGQLQRESEVFHEGLREEYESKCGRPRPTAEPTPNPGKEPSPECRQKMEAVHADLEALMRKWDERHRAFQEAFDAARKEFSQSPHTEAEWKEFGEAWERKAKGLYEEMTSDVRAFMEAHGLKDCSDQTGEWGEAPMPAYGSKPRPATAAYPEYTPVPAAEHAYAEDPEVAQVRKECEAKARRLMDEYESPRPATSNGTAGNASTSEPDSHRELKGRMLELQRECERRIRELHEGRHGRKDKESDHEFGSFRIYFDESTGRIIVKGKHVTLEGVPEAQMMTKITVGGQLYVDQLFVKGYLAEFRMEQTEIGSAIQVYDPEGRRILSIHDNPRGVINVAPSAEIQSITLDLADYLSLERTPNGIRFTDGSREGIVLLHGGDAEIADGNVVTLTGKATFVVSAEAATPEMPRAVPVEQAILEKRLGAEVVVSVHAGKLAAESTPYGDLDVRVSKAGTKKIVALVESEAGTGKTVVLKFDADVFGSDKLKVGVVGVNADGSESALVVAEASSLEDVLDPHDDGEAVEYWIVSDSDGVQLLVSFPHFSEKKVTVESVGASALGSLPGFEGVFGLLAVGAVAVGIGLRRRC